MAKLKPKIEPPEEVDNIYYAIFNNCIDAVFITAPDGRIFSANPAACRMFERTEEEICALGRSGIIDTSDPRLGKAIAERNQNRYFSGELSGLRRDGSMFPIFVTSSIFTDSQGEPRSGMIIRDITKYKIANKKLVKSEFQLKEAQKTAHIGSWDYDVVSDKVTWSREMFKIFERDPAGGEPSWIGHRSHIYEKDWVRTDNAVQKAINEGIPYKFEFRIIKPDKSLKWAYTIGKVDKDSSGKVLRLFGTVQDISERKRTEETLQKSELFLQTILSNAPITIFATDNKGIFTYSDGKELKNVGLKPGENVGISALDLYGSLPFIESPNKKIRGKEVLTRALAGEKMIVNNELNGVWFENQIGPILNEDGEVMGIVGVATNITERKRTEEKLKQSTEEYRTLVQHIEEEMENERTKIARDLHDDLGQKLSILNMDISWIKSRIGVQSPSVENKLNEMLQLLTETMGSIKKISFGLRPSILDDLGIQEAIKWQLRDFRKTTGITSLLSVLPKDLVIDKSLSIVFFRIIQESLTNIARHSGAKNVSVILKSDEELLKLMIQDNGKGIEPGQIDDPKSFGLIGIRERARSFGGDVSISGKKGKGTLVTVVIPVGNGK